MSEEIPPRGTARERHERRRQQRDTVIRRTGTARQISPADAPRMRLPAVNLAALRWALLAVGAAIMVVAVLVISGLINPPEVTGLPNAIWLDARWTHTERSDAEIDALAQKLRENGIGVVFAYVSSMLEDETWAGAPNDATGRFNAVEPRVISFVERLKKVYPQVELYAWIEVQTTTPAGYRLDSTQVQRVVADLSQRAVQVMGFTGVMLDAKPIFDGNPDYPVLLQAVRRSIGGLDTPLAVAVPPDLTPTDAGITLPSSIAPNTVWSPQYKQRIALQADKLVVSAYNSYLTDPVDYITWVSYQVTSFITAMETMDITSTLIIGLPNYAAVPPAHDTQIESMSAALDGVARSLPDLDEDQRFLLQGVAIFTDHDLTEDEWRVFREKKPVE
jgi:hypothetical protein